MCVCVRRNVTETLQRIPQIALDNDPALADGEAVVLTPQRGNVFLQEGKRFEGILDRKNQRHATRGENTRIQKQRDLGSADSTAHASRATPIQPESGWKAQHACITAVRPRTDGDS